MPLPKERAYLLLVAIGIAIAVVSATLDHGHAGLRDPWMWVAAAAGVFAAAAVLLYALEAAPGPEARVAAVVALAALGATGLLGEAFHLAADLALGEGRFVAEKFIRGAPVLAPLLYAYMAALGLIALLLPDGRGDEPASP
jgi:hypothetical protein